MKKYKNKKISSSFFKKLIRNRSHSLLHQKLYNSMTASKLMERFSFSFPILSVSRLQFTFKSFLTTNAHLGYDLKRWNPEMRMYIWAQRSQMHVLNIQVTTLVFRRMFNLLSLLIKLRKSLLFISENKYIDHVLKRVVLNMGQHMSSNRWIGGVITNFQFLLKYIYFLLLRKDPYNIMSRKKKKLKIIFDGIKNMRQIPILGVILNGVKSKWALNELRSFNILCTVIVDSSMGAPIAPFIIPGNVYGFAAQIFYIKLFENAIKNAHLREKKFFFNCYNSLTFYNFFKPRIIKNIKFHDAIKKINFITKLYKKRNFINKKKVRYFVKLAKTDIISNFVRGDYDYKMPKYIKKEDFFIKQYKPSDFFVGKKQQKLRYKYQMWGFNKF